MLLVVVVFCYSISFPTVERERGSFCGLSAYHHALPLGTYIRARLDEMVLC